MKFLAIIPAVLLVGCATAVHSPGKDEYKFGTPSINHTDVHIKVVTVSGPRELRSLMEGFVGDYKTANINGEVLAFSKFSKTDNTCTIYMVDPKETYKPEIIGHEFLHCVYGDWHKGQ